MVQFRLPRRIVQLQERMRVFRLRQLQALLLGGEGVTRGGDGQLGNGADIATVPYKVLMQMVRHPLTDEGIDKFRKDYLAVFGE